MKSKKQLELVELNVNRPSARPQPARRRRSAREWFLEMRRAVDHAFAVTSPQPPPEQIYFQLRN